jgi:hypothetical protein
MILDELELGAQTARQSGAFEEELFGVRVRWWISVEHARIAGLGLGAGAPASFDALAQIYDIVERHFLDRCGAPSASQRADHLRDAPMITDGHPTDRVIAIRHAHWRSNRWNVSLLLARFYPSELGLTLDARAFFP